MEFTKEHLRGVLLANRHITKDGCWEWTGCLINRDTKSRAHTYGQLRTGQKTRELAHRVSFKVFNGKIPKGKVVMHTCDNGPCFNPEHLSIGTHQDNMVDALEKGRFHGRGKESPLWTMEVGTSMHFKGMPNASYIARKRGIYFSVRRVADGFKVYALKEKPKKQTLAAISRITNLVHVSEVECIQILNRAKTEHGYSYQNTIRAALTFWASSFFAPSTENTPLDDRRAA